MFFKGDPFRLLPLSWPYTLMPPPVVGGPLQQSVSSRSVVSNQNVLTHKQVGGVSHSEGCLPFPPPDQGQISALRPVSNATGGTTSALSTLASNATRVVGGLSTEGAPITMTPEATSVGGISQPIHSECGIISNSREVSVPHWPLTEGSSRGDQAAGKSIRALIQSVVRTKTKTILLRATNKNGSFRSHQMKEK